MTEVLSIEVELGGEAAEQLDKLVGWTGWTYAEALSKIVAAALFGMAAVDGSL